MIFSWQDGVVALIVVLCVTRMGIGLWQLYQKSKRADENPCIHCSQPCDIKRLYDQKMQDCCCENKKTKKTCCE
jgi:hypothetical protein